MTRARLGRALLALALTPLFGACGAVRFQRAWSGYEPPAELADTSPAQPAPSSPASIEGRWRGEWRSSFNGHSGGLRCLLTPVEDPGRVRAWFYSTYASILFFQYQTELALSLAPDGRVFFEGEQDLGKAVGGVYRYDGVIDGARFHAHFRADNGDYGVFEMRRVE